MAKKDNVKNRQQIFGWFYKIFQPWKEVINTFIKMVLEDLVSLNCQELCKKTSTILCTISFN